MTKINIAELLKDCPTGMELNCLMYEDVYFDYVDELNIIHCYIQHETNKTSITFNQHGTPNGDIKSKCVIFPTGKTTWEGFEPPCKFKDGDIISDSLGTCIFKGEGTIKGTVDYYCGVHTHYFDVKDNKQNPDGHYGNIVDYRLATEEEKQKLFKAIKDNDYHWNADMKFLEELIESNEEENIEKRILKTEFIEYLEMLGGVIDIDGNKITPPEDYLIGKITKVDNGMLVEFVKKKPQYPKTYVECCDILGYKASYDLNNIATHDCVYDYKLQMLYRVLICRDAYWKIAGEQMGLDKSWSPDWDNLSTKHEFIKINKGCFTYSSRVLVFPTEEMRDAFYENFKDLIENCKELL